MSNYSEISNLQGPGVSSALVAATHKKHKKRHKARHKFRHGAPPNVGVADPSSQLNRTDDSEMVEIGEQP